MCKQSWNSRFQAIDEHGVQDNHTNLWKHWLHGQQIQWQTKREAAGQRTQGDWQTGCLKEVLNKQDPEHHGADIKHFMFSKNILAELNPSWRNSIQKREMNSRMLLLFVQQAGAFLWTTFLLYNSLDTTGNLIFWIYVNNKYTKLYIYVLSSSLLPYEENNVCVLI